MRWLNDFSSWVKGLRTRLGQRPTKKGRTRPASDFFVEYNFPRSADEKLKSLSKGQGSRPTNQVSPAAAGPAVETPERSGRREVPSTDPQSKARHRSRSEGPRRGERLRLFDKNDSHGPQWAVAHEPRRSPRPLCLRQFSDDDIPEVNQSGSDTDSGDSGPKRWTRNPLLIKKTKKVEKTRSTDWKHIAVPPPAPAPVPVTVPAPPPADDNKSQTMPTSVGRTNFDSPTTTRGQVIPNTWSNPDRIVSASPKGKFQRLEEMRQQRMEVYPTSDEEGNPHSEISNQIRQRLSQVQAGRGRGRKASLGEYDSFDNKSGQEYTNYLKNAGDQMILEPKLNSEVSKPAPMTSSFPSYRPMSTAFSGGNGSLSPTVTTRRDSLTPNEPDKQAKPRMVVVEYPLRNQQNGGFKLDPKYESSSAAYSANLRSDAGRNQAAQNPNRNSTAIAFGNNIQCIIPSQQQSTQQQPQFQPQPPMLPPRQQPVQQQQESLLQPQSPLLQPHRLLTQQQTQLHSRQDLPQSQPQSQPQSPLLQQSLQREPLLKQQQQTTSLHQPTLQQRQSFLQQHEQQLRELQIEHQQQFQQHEQQLKQLQFEHQQQLQQMQLGHQNQQTPLTPQQVFAQPENVESPKSHIKPFGSSSPLPSYRPVSFQPPHEAENGLNQCPPPPVEFRTPEKQEHKAHRSKTGSQKRHSRAEPISLCGATNSDGGMLNVPARHISKSYSDGDSLDELLESNMPYLESGSEINTLQLHRHSMKVIEDSLNGLTTTTTTITDTISVTQPTSPDVLRPMPIIPDVQPQQATSPLPPPAMVPTTAVPQMQAPKPEPMSKMPAAKRPSLTGFSPLTTSASNFSKVTKPPSSSPPTKLFESATYPSTKLEPASPSTLEGSELGFMDYKPIITISESLLVNESNKTKRSIDADRKVASDNRLSSSSTPSTVSSQTLNSSPQPGLCVPIVDAGMFSDVDYDIEVAERVKKWEKYMKTPPKNVPVPVPAPTETKPADLAGDNTLATTVKDMANEWSKYLSVIEEDTVASKPYTSDALSQPAGKTPPINTQRKHSLEAQKKVSLLLKAPTQTGSISDSDMYKGTSPHIPTLESSKGLLHVTPIQEPNTSLALSRSYHEGAPNRSSSLDSPLFIPARQFSNSSPAADVVVPARSPVAHFEFFSPPQNRSTSSLNTDCRIAGSRSEQPTSDLFEITRMTENHLRRKSDTQAMRVSSQLSPRGAAIADQCSWKNLIGDMQGKLKDTEIWSPQMDSHQGPVSIERVTARTLETIPFSEDPFWKEIEELTNFDQLMRDLPNDPKSPPPPVTSRSKVFFPPETTNASCYQVSMVSSQPSTNYSLSSLLSSLTEATAPKKSCSTSNLKTSFKSSDGMNALDEVLLDLQPVLGNKLTTPSQNKRYGSSTDLSNNTSPRRPVSYHSASYTTKTDAQNPQGLKAMVGSTTEVKDSQSFSSLTQLQESHSSMTYQSMTNLGEKQYENVVNGNYQLDPSILKEKLINTGLVERSPSGDELALFMKNSKSSNVLVAVKEPENLLIQPPPEENIEELKVLARQVEDKLSEIKTKILKADENNLDKILNALKTFSPSTSAMLSANVQTPTKVVSRDSYIARKGKLNDAISELEKIYDKLNLGSEVYMEHARSTEFPSSLTGQESHGFRLSSSFSQLYEASHQTSSDTFHSDIRFLSSSDHGSTSNRHYGELPQVPVKDVGSEYPVKISTSALTMGSKIEDASGDSVVSNDAPTRRSRTRRQRRAAALASESNQDGRKARNGANKDDNDAPRAYIMSVTVEKSPRSKSSVRADGMDGGSSRQANGSRRPKPPPRSSSLHRKPGRDDERGRRKSTPPDFDLKPGNNDALSQSCNSHTEPAEESRLMPKMMIIQQQRQELSCSSDSSAETIQQKKRAVSKSIAKMVDLFSSSDEERHKKSRVRPKPEQPAISEICEEAVEKVSEDSRSSKSSPKSQPSGKIMTPRSVKQRHDAKRQKAAALAQQTSIDTCSAAVSDETPATEDSSAASKPPLPLRRQRSQSSEKCVSSSEENALDEGAKSDAAHESSQSERNSKEKSSPSLSNASRNRWSISSARELIASDSSISSEPASGSGKVVIDRAERCRSFHELFASFEPDQKRIEKLRRLQKSVSEEGAPEEGTMRTFRSEPDLRDGKSQIGEVLGPFHLTIRVND